MKAGPPDRLQGPDDEDYTREDLAAANLGYGALTLRKMYHNITGRNQGSHHLGHKRIKAISGPWYCHSGPPTKYLRTQDIDAIKKSQKAAASGWTDDDGKPRQAGEYLVGNVWCVDRNEARKLGLNPNALDKAVAAGDIERYEVVSRKGGRKTAIHPKGQVLAEIERLASGFDGEYSDGRINLGRVEKDYDIPATRLRGWIAAGIIGDATKKRPPRLRGLCKEQWTVTRERARELKALLGKLKRGDSLRLAGESTRAEICTALGLKKETAKVIVGLLLQEGREGGLIPARKPTLPIKSSSKHKGARVWLYDTPKAIAFLSSPPAQRVRPKDRGGRPVDPDTQARYRICWEIYTSGKKTSLAMCEARRRLGEDDAPSVWSHLRSYAKRYAKKNGLGCSRAK